MPEVTAAQASQIVGVTDDTVRNYVERGLLPARRQGIKRIIYIDLDNLKRFANQYNFRFDQAAADRITRQ